MAQRAFRAMIQKVGTVLRGFLEKGPVVSISSRIRPVSQTDTFFCLECIRIHTHNVPESDALKFVCITVCVQMLDIDI